MKLELLIDDVEIIQNIVGVKDQNIKMIEELFETNISIRGNEIFSTVEEEQKSSLEEIFKILIHIAKHKYQITTRDIIYIHNLLLNNKGAELLKLYDKPIIVGKKYGGKEIVAKTLNQRIYINELKSKDIIFGVGPAGTGKTYLAVSYATTLLKEGMIKKIILTRPAVEAGESLGYLPGDLKEKIDPYLRPLYDSLYDTLGFETTNDLINKEVIEIAPLAYMRGRTLENACIILDEAQNTTTKQMKMFLTRMGLKSKMIITGDISQTDLPKGVKSGLQQVIKILSKIKEIGVVNFDRYDVVRHPLVAKILECYQEVEGEKYE